MTDSGMREPSVGKRKVKPCPPPGELPRSSFKVRNGPSKGTWQSMGETLQGKVLILQNYFSWRERKHGQGHYYEPKN